MSSFSSNSSLEDGTPIEIIFQDTQLAGQSSSEEMPMSNWSSLELIEEEEVKEHHEPRSSGANDEICCKYIAVSQSDVHIYLQYPAVKDPGIVKALYEVERQQNYPDDGQSLYLALCKDILACPVRMFHRGLLTSVIDLSYYGVKPLDVRIMAIALQNNRCVETLDLTENFLNDDACYHLGQMLYSNTTLQELNLAGCRIRSTGVLRLGNYMHLNRALKVLNLAGNDIGEEGGVHIADMIMRGITVKRLNLSNNGLGRLTALAFTDVFLCNDKITHLDLSLNQFYQPLSTSKMLNSLIYSQCLQELNLSWNALEGEKIADSIKNITVIPTLISLNLSHNRFTGEDISTIVGCLLLAPSLETLDLSSNPMTPNDATVALKLLLFKRVKLQNLIMADVPVNKNFIHILELVRKMESRKNFVVTHDIVLKDWTTEGPDAREVVLKRADYLVTKNKRCKINMRDFFFNLNKETTIMTTKELLDLVEAQGIPFGEDLVDEMAFVFPARSDIKSKIISLDKLCDYIKRLWPDPKKRRSRSKSRTAVELK